MSTHTVEGKFYQFLSMVVELTVLLVTMFGPLTFLAIALLCNLYLLIKPVLHSALTFKPYSKAFAEAREQVAKYWIYHGKVWHAVEIDGMENIPDKGAAVLVYYHGAIPIDYAVLVSTILIQKKRIVRSVVDKYFIWLPGLEMVVKAFGFHASSRAKCAKMLRNGHLLGVAPGGGYEAQLGTPDYKVLWKKRRGFAITAIEGGNVPIIPVFTENIREAYVNLQCYLPFYQWLYNLTKIPMIPLYGGFPVKLSTHIGKPVYPQDYPDVESLRAATVQAMEDLIKEHQTFPASVPTAIKQRTDLLPNPFVKHYDFVVRKFVSCLIKLSSFRGKEV